MTALDIACLAAGLFCWVTSAASAMWIMMRAIDAKLAAIRLQLERIASAQLKDWSDERMKTKFDWRKPK